MIDYPNNPIEGQYFVDDNNIAWRYETGIWQKSLPGEVLSIGQMTDVTNNNAQQYDTLKYDGTRFINTQLPPVPTMPNLPSNRYIFHVTNSVLYRGGSTVPSLGYYGYGASSIIFDPNNMVDTVNRRINIPVTGYWRIILRSVTSARETDTAGYIFVNGVMRTCMFHNYPSYGDNVYGDEYYIGNSSDVLLLNSGDYIDVRSISYTPPSGQGYIQAYSDTEFSGFLMRKI